MRSRLLQEMIVKAAGYPRGKPAPPGTEIEHPLAWMHVVCGFAEPADDECRQKIASLGMTEITLQKARYVYERTARGIHPDDYTRYDRGEIVGYNPDGSVIPGPNYEEECEDD